MEAEGRGECEMASAAMGAVNTCLGVYRGLNSLLSSHSPSSFYTYAFRCLILSLELIVIQPLSLVPSLCTWTVYARLHPLPSPEVCSNSFPLVSNTILDSYSVFLLTSCLLS